MKTITFDITAEDIQLGKRGHPELCAVGRALTRSLRATDGPGRFVSIYPEGGKAYNIVIDQGRFYRYACVENLIVLPFDVVQFIKNFDDGKKVNPVTLTVQLMEVAVKTGESPV